MDHFLYRDGALHAEDVPVADIAAAVGTPVYIYSSGSRAAQRLIFGYSDKGDLRVG